MKPETPKTPKTFDEAIAADVAEGYQFIRSRICPDVVFGFKASLRSSKITMKGYKGTRARRPRFCFTYRSREEAYAFAKEFAEGMLENEAHRLRKTQLAG